MAEFDLDKMAEKMAEKALDEFICNGKTLREWIEIIVAQDLLAIAELEKIKAEMVIVMGSVAETQEDLTRMETRNDDIEIIDKRIAELKGEKDD